MTDLELSKHDEMIRHNAVQETHWHTQKWMWAGTVLLLALGIIFK